MSPTPGKAKSWSKRGPSQCHQTVHARSWVYMSLPRPMAMQGVTSRNRGSVTEQSPHSHRIRPPAGGERKTIRDLLLPQSKKKQSGGGSIALSTELQEEARGRAASLGQWVPPTDMPRAALPKGRIRLHMYPGIVPKSSGHFPPLHLMAHLPCRPGWGWSWDWS